MKCTAHNSEAVAICAYCGRALCADCAKPSTTQRMVCSENCAAALVRDDRAMQLILQKSLQNARASALYCYLCAALSAGAAVGAWFYLPLPFLVWFTAGCSVVFAASGIWYGRIAKKQKPES
jgi:predicted nucleic acid-binding Zn ribbon protein